MDSALFLFTRRSPAFLGQAATSHQNQLLNGSFVLHDGILATETQYCVWVTFSPVPENRPRCTGLANGKFNEELSLSQSLLALATG